MVQCTTIMLQDFTFCDKLGIFWSLQQILFATSQIKCIPCYGQTSAGNAKFILCVHGQCIDK